MGNKSAILRLLVNLHFLDGAAAAGVIAICINLPANAAFAGLVLVFLSVFVGAVSVLLWYEVADIESSLDAYEDSLSGDDLPGEGYAND